MTSIDNLNHNKKNFLLSHSVEITHDHSLMSMLEERTLSHLNMTFSVNCPPSSLLRLIVRAKDCSKVGFIHYVSTGKSLPGIKVKVEFH